MRSRIGRWLGVELVEVSPAEKIVAMAGGGISILALIALTLWRVPDAGATAVIASMGASAVLLFAVPHGALSQPWPVIVGHTLSAAIGVSCAQFIPHTAIAAACAVGLAIGAMHQFKCIHPPGGATALTAVLGSNAIKQLGFGYVLFPVFANAAIMVGLAVLINSVFRWRRYPAALAGAVAAGAADAARRSDPSHEEVLAALRSLDSFVDITEEDLVRLSRILADRGVRSG